MKFSRNVAITLVCIILGVVLAWQYKSINFNENAASIQSKRTEDLMSELIKLQKSNNDLKDRLQELQEDNRALETAKVGDNEVAQQFKDSLEKTRVFVGLTDVTGKGVILDVPDNGNVYGGDILDLVNELRAAGAQAISVNDERIVAMTEIRDTSNYIVINGSKVNSPYKIKAISDPDVLERSLKMIGGIIEDFEGIGIYVKITKSDNITIQKLRDDAITQRYDLLAPAK